jgi:antitoxin component of MazEF toxin-antitoxin module
MATPLKREFQACLTRQGDSTALTLPREVLQAADLARGDSVTIMAERAMITVRKADDDYTRAMAAGRAFVARYRRSLAALAR